MSYLTDLQNKYLHEIVIPGSHDAGIYGDDLKGNVKTQNLNIQEQARCGCRFFDMRIAACAKKTKVSFFNKFKKKKSNYGQLNQTEVTLKSYHLDKSLVKDKKYKNKANDDNDGVDSTQSMRNLGGFGQDSLETMLHQAGRFVKNNKTEFLILNFSKSYNWRLIAEKCHDILWGEYRVLFPHVVNLNLQKVSTLSGSVITLFPRDDDTAFSQLSHYRASMDNGNPFHNSGINWFKKSKSKEGYKFFQKDFQGIQCFGQFSGTDDWSVNKKRQKASLTFGARSHPHVLGMMYWTTTGMTGNILKRNKLGWSTVGIKSLQETWQYGLGQAMRYRIDGGKGFITSDSLTKANVDPTYFMPNIVMIDNVDKSKCRIIKELNRVKKLELFSLFDNDYESDDYNDKKSLLN